MVNEENETKPKETQKSREYNLYEEIFSFKKKFNIKKFEELDSNDKSIVEEKLNQIKNIQQDINNLLEKTK
jgi:hypothetical protein